eukprot:6490270-Amphidinium_carterae.3
MVNIESFADSDWAGCSSKKRNNYFVLRKFRTPLLHISRTQSVIEAQHIKQVFEEMAIPNIIPHVTMSINTDSTTGKAVASRLGPNKKTKHLQLRYLHMQDIIQRGERTITKIPTTDNPAEVLTKHLPSTTINSHFDLLCLQTTTSTARALRLTQAQPC